MGLIYDAIQSHLQSKDISTCLSLKVPGLGVLGLGVLLGDEKTTLAGASVLPMYLRRAKLPPG